MAPRRSLLSLYFLLASCAIISFSRSEELYWFDVDKQANIYATISGFLYYPRPHNGCTPLLDSPPSDSNWFALLDNYHECTLEKINNTRNAGYQLLFTPSIDDKDRNLTDDVINTEFPIAVPLTSQANYLRENATTFENGPIYVSVQLIIDEELGELEIKVLVVDNSSYPSPPGPMFDSSTIPLIVFVCAVSVFMIVVVVMIVVRCAHNISSQNDSEHMYGSYGAIEEKSPLPRDLNAYNCVQYRTNVQLVNMKDSTRHHRPPLPHRGGHTTNTHHETEHLLRQSSSPADLQTQHTASHPPAEQSHSDTRTASWVHSHFGSSVESKFMRHFDIKRDSCTPACVVCLKMFKENEQVVALPCDPHHIFHLKCIAERFSKSGKACPLCTSLV